MTMEVNAFAGSTEEETSVCKCDTVPLKFQLYLCIILTVFMPKF